MKVILQTNYPDGLHHAWIGMTSEFVHLALDRIKMFKELSARHALLEDLRFEERTLHFFPGGFEVADLLAKTRARVSSGEDVDEKEMKYVVVDDHESLPSTKDNECVRSQMIVSEKGISFEIFPPRPHQAVRTALLPVSAFQKLEKKAPPKPERPEPPITQCGNCSRVWDEDDLKHVWHLTQRVSPGETMPAGECPDDDCRALCFPYDRGHGCHIDHCPQCGGDLTVDCTVTAFDVPVSFDGWCLDECSCHDTHEERFKCSQCGQVPEEWVYVNMGRKEAVTRMSKQAVTPAQDSEKS